MRITPPKKIMPAPRFKDEQGTLETLSNVAEMLKVYNTAVVHVEAHKATRSGQLDQGSLQITQQQAELVKSTLVACGVEPGRLVAVGLPGSRGSNRSEVVLRITSY